MTSKEERQAALKAYLAQEGQASVGLLCQALHYSEATIRRDLAQLAQSGEILRVRGGAMPNTFTRGEPPFSLRSARFLRAKHLIARCAASLVRDGDTLFLDASSTTLCMIDALSERRGLTIITTGVHMAAAIAEKCACRLIVPGGTLIPYSDSLAGAAAVEAVSGCFADALFFSAQAVSPERGIMDVNEEIARVKQAMLRHAKTAYLLCDSSKFDTVARSRIAGLEEVSRLITEEMPQDGECWAAVREKIMVCKG